MFPGCPSTRPTPPDVTASANGAIIGNQKSKVYHRPDCPGAAKVSPQNRVRFTTEAEAQGAGYRLVGNCPECQCDGFLGVKYPETSQQQHSSQEPAASEEGE